MSDNSLLWIGGGIAAVLLLLLLLASGSPDPGANTALEEPISTEASSILQTGGSSEATLAAGSMEIPPATVISSTCSPCMTSTPCSVPAPASPCRTISEPDPCAPATWACDDPCVQHVSAQRAAPLATACNCAPPCGYSAEPTTWPCSQPASPCAAIPSQTVIVLHNQDRPSSGVIRSGGAATVLIERSYPEWVTEGQTAQLHGRITTPVNIPVCFEWTAERGSFDDPTSLDPVYTAPAAVRWGDSVCIKLEIHDAYGVRRYDQIELRIGKALF